MTAPRKTVPPVSLLAHDTNNRPLFPYVHSSRSDIRERFEAVRAALAPKPSAPKTKTKPLRVVGR